MIYFKNITLNRLDPEMEIEVYKWYENELKTLGRNIARGEIKKKARSISKMEGFKASKGW